MLLIHHSIRNCQMIYCYLFMNGIPTLASHNTKAHSNLELTESLDN